MLELVLSGTLIFTFLEGEQKDTLFFHDIELIPSHKVE